MQAGDAEHGVVDAVALESAVAEDLPGIHAGEGVLDAGPDLAVGGVVFLFPGGEFGLAGFAAVRDDQWGRTGLRSDGSEFTVLTLGQYFLHELAHHLVDVRA